MNANTEMLAELEEELVAAGLFGGHCNVCGVYPLRKGKGPICASCADLPQMKLGLEVKP